MALARVVAFDGVSTERMHQLSREMEEGGPPDDVPATEVVVLHDPETEKALVIFFFGSEEDYRRADEALDAMPSDETPGSRTAVTRYDVAARMTR